MDGGTPPDPIGALIAGVDTAAACFTLIRVGIDSRMTWPAGDGVAAILILSGTAHIDGAGMAGAGTLILLPVDHAPVIADAPGVVGTERRAAHCLVIRDGWLVADMTADDASGAPAAELAAMRIVGSNANPLPGPTVLPVLPDAVGATLFALLRTEVARRAGGHPALAAALMSGCVIQALRVAARHDAAATPTTRPSLRHRLLASFLGGHRPAVQASGVSA